jgi:molybdopterin-guanine dinucleotide biosynthesis protein A
MGQPKAWLPCGDELMLQRVVRIVREAVDTVVVVAAVGQKLPALPCDVAIVRDEHEERGPLQGLATGLKALEGQVDCAYLSSCDVPFLRSEFVRRVISILKEYDFTPTPWRIEIAVPRIGDRFHPLAAAFRRTDLPHVLQHLSANQLRLTDLIDALPTRIIEAHEFADVDPTLESLRNINTRQEYEAAVQELKSRHSD